MRYLCENATKVGVTDIVSEAKCVEIYPDIWNLAHENSAWSTGVYS